MKRHTAIGIAVALALGAHFASAQTVTTTTSTTTSSTTTIRSESEYMTRVAPRFEGVAGSSTNLQSLVHGLRTGSEVRLAGEPGTETVVFTPSTRPMGYGNITRSLDLAQRQLAAVGIDNPTPQQLNAALNGGTITTANGATTLSGVLQLRSQGMGWGKIAHTVGVHPGMGKGPATSTASTSVTTSGVTTAAGTTASASTRATTAGGKVVGQGVTTAAGAGGHAHGAGKGITTAGGASVSHGRGRMSVQAGDSSVVTGAGATVNSGVTTAGGGHGQGHGYGRGGKH